MTLSHSASSSRSASLLGSLALGFGLSLFAMSGGCSSNDSTATPTDEGGAGTASAGAAGSAAGSAGSGGGAAGSASGTDGGGLCARHQNASDIGDHCVADGGEMIKTPATACPTQAAGDGGADEMYPGPHSGTFTDDDDCKYDVSYGVACDGGGLQTFTVNLKSRVTGMGVPGANPSIEASLDDTHPLPNSPMPVTTDLGNGDYKIAGVPFDKDGFWVVRFHFFETCAESPDTKHGHVAFTVIVE